MLVEVQVVILSPELMTEAYEVPHDERQLNRRWGIGLDVAVRAAVARLLSASG